MSRKYSLKELRARFGETQKEFADAIGVSTATASKWEHDLSTVSVSKIMAIAKHFDVTIDDLLFCPEHEESSCER